MMFNNYSLDIYKYFCCIFLCAFSNLSLAQNSIIVHQKDGLILKSFIDDIDSINFVTTDLTCSAEMIFVPIFGQSLAMGSASVPVISTTNKYNTGLMFQNGVRYSLPQTEFVPLCEMSTMNEGETAASGCVEEFVYTMNKESNIPTSSIYWQNHQLLFVACGAGSKTIKQLRENYVGTIQKSLENAKKICDRNNYKLRMPALIWIQGETDQKQSNSENEYKLSLEELQQYITHIADSILGNNEEVKFICYQTSSQNIVGTTIKPSYTTTAMDIPNAQMSLIRDNENFIASCPTYILDHSIDQPIHLSALGEKLLGMYAGLGLYDLLVNNKGNNGFTFKNAVVDKNRIIVYFNIPQEPIIIDNTWCNPVPNYGFSVINKENKDIVNNVTVFSNHVIIDCYENPDCCKLFYGFNGNADRDGRLEGSRGNLKDCTRRIGLLENQEITMSNWLYSFYTTLSVSQK